MQRTRERKEEYREAVSGVEKAIANRVQVQLDFQHATHKPSEEEIQGSLNEADGALNRAKEKRQIAEEDFRLEHQEDAELCELILGVAENTLLTLNLIRPVEVQLDDRQPEEQQPQESQEAGIAAQSGAEHYRDSYAENADSFKGQGEQEPAAARDIWHMAQDQALDELEKAENELRQIEYLRDRARRHHTEEVAAFLRVTHSGDLKDAKTDFDRLHFIKQTNFTAELREVQARVERSKDSARRLRALDFEDQASNFGDLSDGGYQDVSRCGDDPLWELKNEEIRDWADRETDRLFSGGADAVVGEDDWSVLDPREEPGGKHIEAFEDGIQPYLDDLNERSKHRKMIDDWQRQQECRLESCEGRESDLTG